MLTRESPIGGSSALVGNGREYANPIAEASFHGPRISALTASSAM
jgi:hypothetical protein